MAAWDISTAVYSQNFSVSIQDTAPTGIFFKPDGRKMYVIGSTGDNVYEYDLSTAWDVSSAVYLQLFPVAGQTPLPNGLFFKPDGTKMYVLGRKPTPPTVREVYEYNLGTAWDVSSAVYSQLFSVAAQETLPTGIFFKSDGTKMYVLGSTGDDVNEYNLGTAWDVSSASYLQNFSVAAQETLPTGIFFKSDGTKMYVTGTVGDDVNEYNIGTAWDVSTAVYSQSFPVAAQETSPQELFFKSDGTKMYVIGTVGDDVNEYDLSERWCGVSSAVYLQLFSVAAQDTVPTGIFFKPDGRKMYVIGQAGDNVYEYNLGTAWDVSTAVYSQLFSVAGEDTSPMDISFKPDGTKMYVLGSTGDNVYEYNLGTAWDVSSAVYSQLFSVAAQEGLPTGLFFKPDGTKMYIIGIVWARVFEYNLGTAWDVSSAVYSQLFSVAAQEIDPQGLFFKSDGTKMYVTGTVGDDVNEYNIGTAWDVSTASYLQNFSVAAQETSPYELFFRHDGRKMYIIGSSGDEVNEYDLSCYLLRNPSMGGGMV